MKFRSIRNSVLAAGAVVALTLVTTTPASADLYTRSCGGGKSFYIGVVSDGSWADDRSPMGDCGDVSTRSYYKIGHDTWYTAWVTHSNFASVTIPTGAGMISGAGSGGSYTYTGLVP